MRIHAASLVGGAVPPDAQQQQLILSCVDPGAEFAAEWRRERERAKGSIDREGEKRGPPSYAVAGVEWFADGTVVPHHYTIRPTTLPIVPHRVM